MNVRYNGSYGAALSLDESGKPQFVTHSHEKQILYTNYGWMDKKKLKEKCDHQITAVKGCMAFFKAYRDDQNQPTEIKAIAAAAVAEDEERLNELNKHRPSSSCNLL